MKKSTFNITLLSVLFVLGACSVDGSDTDGGGDTGGGDVTVPGGTGDPATDEALGDSLGQLTGSVEGMEIGSSSVKSVEDGFIYNKTKNLYLGSDKFASVSVTMLTGGSGDNVWNNDVQEKSVSEGALAISAITAAEVKTSTGNAIADLKGYTTLHKRTLSLFTLWYRELISEAGAWDPDPNPPVQYYLVKETSDELSEIPVIEEKGNYKLLIGEPGSTGEVTMDIAIKYATTYKIKSSDTGGGDVTVPGGTGDPATDAALGDALDKIGSVEGMEIGSSSVEFKEDDFTYNTTANLYSSTDKYAQVVVTILTGTDNLGNVWNNDVSYKFVSEGALVISAITADKVKTSTGTAILDLKGYTKLHTATPSLETKWSREFISDAGAWTPSLNPQVQYYLVKETSDELSRIPVIKDIANTGNYMLSASDVDMDAAIVNATTYKIK